MSGRIGTLGAALLAFAALALLGRVLPHWLVLVATLAFAKGLVALGLVVMRRWFGIEARVRCQNDTFITDTWSRPVSIGKAQ